VASLRFGLVVRFSLRPGSQQAFDQLVAETLPLIEKREPGTLLYVVHEVEDDSCGRVFYELYRDRAAFDEHNAQEHVRHFLAEREQYFDEPPRVEFLRMRSGVGPAASSVTRSG
jgi:quinol monooxygenase YgiN